MQNSVSRSVPLRKDTSARALWGMFDRKERWSLSWFGRVVVTSAFLLVGVLIFESVYPFLAITHRVNTDMLVIEGWVREYAITAGAEEFQTAAYHHLFTTGGP